jgi:hypothetical protein
LEVSIAVDEDGDIYAKIEEKAAVGDWVYVARGSPFAIYRKQLVKHLSDAEQADLEAEAEAALQPHMKLIGKAIEEGEKGRKKN